MNLIRVFVVFALGLFAFSASANDDTFSFAAKFVVEKCLPATPCGIPDPVTENAVITLKLVNEDAAGNKSWQGKWTETQAPFEASITVTKILWHGQIRYEIFSDIADAVEDYPLVVKFADPRSLQYTANFGSVRVDGDLYFSSLAFSAAH